jgi:hypothetical protein
MEKLLKFEPTDEASMTMIKLGLVRMANIRILKGENFHDMIWDCLVDSMVDRGLAPYAYMVYMCAGVKPEVWNDSIRRIEEIYNTRYPDELSSSQTSN